MLSVSLEDRRRAYLYRLGIRHSSGALPLSSRPALFVPSPDEPDEDTAPARTAAGSSSGPRPASSSRRRLASEPVPGGERAPEASSSSSSAAPGIGSPPLKGKDDFRVNFLRKLSYYKVWVPQVRRPPKHQTVIIFDWDDTLLCTSFLQAYQGSYFTPLIAEALRGIERITQQLLKLAIRFGHTFIITNSSQGWVEYSAAAYIPDLLPVLRAVPVISARSRYEPQYPNQVGVWKTQAFLEIQRKLDSRIITNLISLGDSDLEVDAAHSMGRHFSKALTKIIKFAENPSPEELERELEKVSEKFGRIVESPTDLRIGLGRRPASKGAEAPAAG